MFCDVFTSYEVCCCIIIHMSILFTQNTNDITILGKWRKVAYIKDFFEVIRDVHATCKGHIETLAEVGKVYECVPRSAIDKFVSLCLVCHMRKPQTTQAPLRPIMMVFSSYRTFCYYIKDVTVARTIVLYLCTNQRSRQL